MPKMGAAIFVEPGRIALDENIPDVGVVDALMRISNMAVSSNQSFRLLNLTAS